MGQKIKEVDEKKYCLYCGNELERKRYNGRLEDFGVFQRRKYCNNECMSKYWLLQPKVNQTWNNAHTTARKINLKIKRIFYCEICHKIGGKLDVHHKNENWKDNSLNNLQIVCRSCHMKIHNKYSVCRICGDKVKGYGYCNKHYIRYKKYGCPLYYGFNKQCKNCDSNEEKREQCINTELENSSHVNVQN